MNMWTKLITVWLNVDITIAVKVKDELCEMGISFSNSTERQLKRAAKEALETLKARGQA
jgi:hypothetical protein